MKSSLVFRILALLFVLMLPVWPVSGTWFGLPAWAVVAVLVSAIATSVTAWLALCQWPEEEAPDADG